MALQLKLQKPGEKAQKLQLSLNKAAVFKVKLAWDSEHDVDAHALLTVNDGSGAKVSDFAQVLSTYNAKKTNPQGVLETNPDGSFSTPCGGLTHSGDALTGSGNGDDADEIITIDGSKVAPEVNEIPIFVTIHKSNVTRATFAQVKSASIAIEDDSGRQLAKFELSGEFGKFNSVQMGSLMRNENGWEFAAVGNGFMGDFNTVLGHFS